MPLSSSSEAQVAQVSGLARLDMLEQEDGHCFRVEHSSMFRNTWENDEPTFGTSCMALQLLGAILRLMG